MSLVELLAVEKHEVARVTDIHAVLGGELRGQLGDAGMFVAHRGGV